MKRFGILLLLPLALTAAMTAVAGEAGKVHVITSHSDGVNCIAPVAIKKIDGREATVQPMGFWIEPGEHTFSGSAVIDTSFCKTLDTNPDRHRVQPLQVNLEAGVDYYIGVDHSSRDREDWKLVVWKIKPAKG